MIAKYLKFLDKKYAFGIVTGLFFGFISFYTDFIRNENPKIEYDILSNTTVVDLKENIGKIDILYDSVSILSNKQTLSIVTLKISNNGNSDVFKNSYDNDFPLGFKIEKGIILENPTIIQSSNKYLVQSIRMESKNKNVVNFSNFIFEKDEFFILKFLVLHYVNEQPEVIPSGKIAGVKNININKSFLNKDSKNLWQRISDGNLLIHTARFFIYFIIFILLVVIIAIPSEFLINIIKKKKRTKKINNYRNHINREFSDIERIINTFYIKEGFVNLKSFMNIIQKYRKNNYLYKVINPNFDPNKMLMYPDKLVFDNSITELIQLLKEKQVLLISEGELNFKDELDNYINHFINYIEMK